MCEKVLCSVQPGGDPNKWVTLGGQHRRGPACLGSLFGEVFPTPPFPQPGLREWLGCGQFVNRSRQRPRPRLVLAFRLAYVGLELPLHAGKRVVKEFSAPIPSAEFAVHGIEACPWCSSCPSYVAFREWSASTLRHRAGLCTLQLAFAVLCSVFWEENSKVFRQEPKKSGSTVA